MTDLVQRLHTAGREVPTAGSLMHEAADRIEQLEKAAITGAEALLLLEKAADHIEHLQRLVDADTAEILKSAGRIEALERENAEMRKDAERMQ